MIRKDLTWHQRRDILLQIFAAIVVLIWVLHIPIVAYQSTEPKSSAESANDKGAPKGNDWWDKTFGPSVKPTDVFVAACTGALVIVGFLQFFVYRQQAKIMTVQLRAATRAASAARDAANALPLMERAYVFLDSEMHTPEIAALPDWQKIMPSVRAHHVPPIFVDFQFRNHGRTPAVIGGVVAGTVYYAEGLPQPIGSASLTIPPLIIGGGDLSQILHVPLRVDYELIGEAKRNDGRIFFVGVITYVDVFRHEHTTGFCRWYDFSTARWRLADSRELNYYT